MKISFALALTAVATSLLACVPHLPPLPKGISAQPVATVSTGTRVAIAPNGTLLALLDPSGLKLRRLSDGSEVVLTPHPVTAAAFSPDAARLAAALPGNAAAEAVVFDTDSGRETHRAPLSAPSTALLWSEQGLLSYGTRLQSYKFGSNLQNWLDHWELTAAPRGEKIHDVTLDPITLKNWEREIASLPAPLLSPWGDEILLPRLIDPPAFPPYLKLTIRHLPSGSEREVATALPLDGGSAAYLAGGDEIVRADARGALQWSPWSTAEAQQLPFAARTVAASPDGALLWLDGRVLRNGAELLRLPAQALPERWLEDGRLFFRWEGRLWQLSGIGTAAKPTPDPARRGRLLLLRKWRATGLISPEDYTSQTQEEHQ